MDRSVGITQTGAFMTAILNPVLLILSCPIASMIASTFWSGILQDFCPFVQKCIGEVRHWCWMMSPVFSGSEAWAGRRLVGFSTPIFQPCLCVLCCTSLGWLNLCLGYTSVSWSPLASTLYSHHQTLELAQCSQTGQILLVFAKPKRIHQIPERKSWLHTPKCTFPLL